MAALALAGHDVEAREALQRYLALPSTGPLKTIAAWKARYSSLGGDLLRVEIGRANVRRPAQGGDAGVMSETRKLAAILVSDIVGYSRLAGSDEDRIPVVFKELG